MTKIIDGKAIAAAVKQRVAEETALLSAEGREITLAVILVGSDPASCVYVRNKERACAETGIRSEKYLLPETASQEELEALIKRLNADDGVDGILCQLPLPRGLDPTRIVGLIAPEKDVDCFNPVNTGLLLGGRASLLPCTPSGVMEMLKSSGIAVAGKRAVVIGRSDIVGKPMALLLLAADATVTVCHSKTVGLAELCREADIIVSAVGKIGTVTADMVSEGAVVIDVGMNRSSEGRLCGDVDFASVAPKCSAISPVPGGVGPMTIAMLMNNTLTAARLRRGIKER